MKFPPCLSEAETVERAIAGANLARYGDGEFNLADGRNCVSQRGDPRLAAELKAILLQAPKGCLPCLPTPYGGTPKKTSWQKFESFSLVLGKQEYGSAFITRPDSAPWIDTVAYWDRVRDLWRGKDVTLVKGSERSLRLNMMTDAKSVREVWGTYRDAYDARNREKPDERDRPGCCQTIDELIDAVGTPGHTVLLCIGATATVMAARLAKKGVHAVDVGHIGMYMRHAGGFRFKPDDLASPEYRALLKQMHEGEKAWGGSGHTHAEPIRAFADELNAEAILDYGCGNRSLERRMAEISKRRVVSYDPAFTNELPKPHDLLACTDVLEHVEPEKLDNVLTNIRALAAKGAYLNIACGPANRSLPDGRNAHLIIHKASWWIEKINEFGWKHAKPPQIGKGVTMWLLT